MIKFTEENNYYSYPFRADEGDRGSDTPSINAGGFNLVENPQDIDKIPEALQSPMLKKLLTDLNKPNTPFITLGCAYWLFKDNRELSRSYLEFTFKNINVANNLTFLQQIDEEFEKYLSTHKNELSQIYSVPPEAFNLVVQNYYWQMDKFSYFGSEERSLIYVEMASQRHSDIEIFLELLHRFLTEYLVVPSYPPNKKPRPFPIRAIKSF